MAYTATVTIDASIRDQERVSRNCGIVFGKVTISSYHATLAEITDITKYFTTTPECVAGQSTNGYSLTWDTTNKAFKCWRADLSASVDGPDVEAANDANIGVSTFIAIGHY